MAFSGTVAQTTFTTRKVIEAAARRARISASQLTAEHVDIAKDQLFLLFGELANQGAPLWCIQKSIYPLYEGVGQVITYSGTVDILNANLRTLQEATGTEATSSMIYSVQFDSDTAVSTVGIKWNAAAVPLTLDRSPDGLSWTVVQSETPIASSGEWTWFDLSSIVASAYFRVRATTGTLGFTEIFLGTTPSETPFGRLNRDDYTALPNKTYSSDRPMEYWLDRQASSPVMQLWPVPSSSAEHSQVVVWAHRHIMDVGTLTQEIEVPQRWYEAIVAMLAAKLALELPEADSAIIPLLDQKAAQSLYVAQQEERDNSPISIMPDFGCYTR